MTTRLIATALMAIAGMALTSAQDVTPEYKVKAAYLYNFVKYVDWPEKQQPIIRICVAGQNPFGTVLESLVRNERVRGVPLAAEVILEARSDCSVLFTPKTANIPVYLRGVAGTPTLTVGESEGFIEQGGMVRFVSEGINVRFEINPTAVDRARLRISSRLLQLARIVDKGVDER